MRQPACGHFLAEVSRRFRLDTLRGYVCPVRAAAQPTVTRLEQTFRGVLCGAAIGDSLGLVAEGLSPSRQRALLGPVWRQRFFLRFGVVSDDTEHAALTALSLCAAGENLAAFRRALAWRLRGWFAALPPGVGLATARACIKLWLGLGNHSGVFSAGNGPSMRAAIIGAYFASDRARREAFVSASTRLTHTDPRANWGALAVAAAAAAEARGTLDGPALLGELAQLSDEAEWHTLLDTLRQHLAAGDSVEAFASALGLSRGVTGYALHSVPVALYAWLRHRPDFEAALEAALARGGDTDSVGAIVGGIAGASGTRTSLPERWLEPIRDWPFGPSGLDRIARLLGKRAAGEAVATPRLFWPLVLLRNLVVLPIVLGHGLRRLFPPY